MDTLTTICFACIKGIMPIPLPLWISEDINAKDAALISADLGYAVNGAGSTGEQEKALHVSHQGICFRTSVRKFYSYPCFSDIIDHNDLKRRQEEETAIRRIGFVFLAYNVEFWY
jgi:hypothetical protein